MARKQRVTATRFFLEIARLTTVSFLEIFRLTIPRISSYCSDFMRKNILNCCGSSTLISCTKAWWTPNSSLRASQNRIHNLRFFLFLFWKRFKLPLLQPLSFSETCQLIIDSLFSRIETDARRKKRRVLKKKKVCFCCESLLRSRIFDWFDSTYS